MALTPFALKLIAPHLRLARVLALGYPDLLMTPSEATEILGCPPLSKSTPHGSAHKREIELADTTEAFRAVGARLTCVDMMPSRGVELCVDLNQPQEFVAFDLVIDAGTIEHCANIGQALMTAASAVRPKGRVFHSPPLSMANHGFYNVSPTLLVDFYEQNGWTVEHLSAFRVRPPYESVEIHARKRFAMVEGVALYFLAQRSDSAELRWPKQAKYL